MSGFLNPPQLKRGLSSGLKLYWTQSVEDVRIHLVRFDDWRKIPTDGSVTDDRRSGLRGSDIWTEWMWFQELVTNWLLTRINNGVSVTIVKIRIGCRNSARMKTMSCLNLYNNKYVVWDSNHFCTLGQGQSKGQLVHWTANHNAWWRSVRRRFAVPCSRNCFWVQRRKRRWNSAPLHDCSLWQSRPLLANFIMVFVVMLVIFEY